MDEDIVVSQDAFASGWCLQCKFDQELLRNDDVRYSIIDRSSIIVAAFSNSDSDEGT
jgi:hypothetical protein